MNKEKINILYITSIGYSGSTLLDRLLETTPGTFSVGEIHILKERCKCGGPTQSNDSVFKSPLWKMICKNFDKYVHKKNKRSSFFLKNLSEFKNKELFNDVKKNGERIRSETIEHIIDSSKDPKRMIALNQERGINTKIIHLIRSPWGVVNSNIGHNRGWIKSCWRWVRTNLAILLYTFLFVSSDKYIRLHYEDVAKKPAREIARVHEKFNTGVMPDNYLTLINNRESYRLSGNAMMYKKINKIRVNESWKKNLTWFQKIVVGILCGPLYLAFWFLYHS